MTDFDLDDGFPFKLTSVAPGRASIPIGPGAGYVDSLVPSATDRNGPLPPGSELLGMPGWPLGEAWQHVLAESTEAQAFLRAHPDALVWQIANSSVSVELVAGVETENEFTWEFRLAAPTGEHSSVTSTKRQVLTVPLYKTGKGSDRDPQVPPGVKPAPPSLASFAAFREFAASLPGEGAGKFSRLTFNVGMFENAPATYFYAAFLHDTKDAR